MLITLSLLLSSFYCLHRLLITSASLLCSSCVIRIACSSHVQTALNEKIVSKKSSSAKGGSEAIERQLPSVLKELPRVLEARESVFDADAKSREALIVKATLRSDSSADGGGIQLRRFPSRLDALITDVGHIAQQEQLWPQEDAACLDERCKLTAATRAVASIEVADAS